MTSAYFVGGPLNNQSFDDVNDVLDIYECSGYSWDMSKERAEGRIVHRPELDNQPQFLDYLGPMWDDSKKCFRYESQAVYDALSR